MNERPQVGLGVIVMRNGKILVGERVSSHGAGTHIFPGGYLEYGESFEQGAIREVLEETGLVVTNPKLVSIDNAVHYDKHFVTIGMFVESNEGEPRSVESLKTKNWQWYDPNNLPDDLASFTKVTVRNWKSKTLYSK